MVLAPAFEMFPLSFVKFYDAIQNSGYKKKKKWKHAINKTVHDVKEKNTNGIYLC